MGVRNSLINFLGGYTDKEYDSVNYDLRQIKIQLGICDVEYAQLFLKIDEKHSSLDKFKTFLDKNIKKVDIRYNYGFGYKQRVSSVLHIESKVEEKYKDFVTTLMRNEKVNNPDDLIYVLKQKLNDFIKNKYNNELKAWGKQGEYWATAEELFDKYVTNNGAGDCDDRALFEYHCFRALLKTFNLWEDNKWRLRCVVVNILGAERHFLLAWVKEGPNAFVPIESTYFPDLFRMTWNHNLRLRDNWLYEIDYSFNESGAYRRMS